MQINQIYTLIKSLGINTKRLGNPQKMTLPFIVFCDGPQKYSGGDDTVMLVHNDPSLEIYTEQTDQSTVSAVITALIKANLISDVEEIGIIDKEKTIETVINLKTQTNKLP